MDHSWGVERYRSGGLCDKDPVGARSVFTNCDTTSLRHTAEKLKAEVTRIPWVLIWILIIDSTAIRSWQQRDRSWEPLYLCLRSPACKLRGGMQTVTAHLGTNVTVVHD